VAAAAARVEVSGSQSSGAVSRRRDVGGTAADDCTESSHAATHGAPYQRSDVILTSNVLRVVTLRYPVCGGAEVGGQMVDIFRV